MRWHRAGDFILTNSCNICFQACLRAGTQCWAFCPTCCPRGDGVNGSLVRSHWGRNFLLRETKAERATLEVALGRLSLVGSQRKPEITLGPGESSVLKHPLSTLPPWACTSASCSIFFRVARWRSLQNALIRVVFSQPGQHGEARPADAVGVGWLWWG